MPSIEEYLGMSKSEIKQRISAYDTDMIEKLAYLRKLDYDETLKPEEIRLLLVVDITMAVFKYRIEPVGHKVVEGTRETYFVGKDYFWKLNEVFEEVEVVGEFAEVNILSLFVCGSRIFGTKYDDSVLYEAYFDYKKGIIYCEDAEYFGHCVTCSERERKLLQTKVLLE